MSDIKYSKHMLKLWNLAGEIGTLGETDARYREVYERLSEALDAAEDTKLIEYKEEG